MIAPGKMQYVFESLPSKSDNNGVHTKQTNIYCSSFGGLLCQQMISSKTVLSPEFSVAMFQEERNDELHFGAKQQFVQT